jgi:membrane peptidoglycan carboxypeptidase
MFDARPTQNLFASYSEIPPLVVGALLFIENRELASDKAIASANPVVEWDRLAKSGFLYIGRELGLPLKVEGGSTLATQLEKYRYSPEGRTFSAGDKLRQMLGASLMVYRTGPDTREARRAIVLDYLNTVPLAAAPGFGEINGLGEGLRAWFNTDLATIRSILLSPGSSREKAEAFKEVFSLLAAVRAPGYYLLKDWAALEKRVNFYAHLMAEVGLLEPEFAKSLELASIRLSPRSNFPVREFTVVNKLVSSLRLDLLNFTGIPNLYDLDRLDLEVQSTLDYDLEEATTRLFEELRNSEFLESHGLKGERLLASGDPDKVHYSLVLFEKTDGGNLLRVQADTYPGPLDLSEGIKMELGSTAKLRTLTHYLEIVDFLYHDPKTRNPETAIPRDPITSWVVDILKRQPGLTERGLLEIALDRTYSANPSETFFTGGGVGIFSNFDPKDNGKKFTVREAIHHSINLVFIRLMRDLVRYHESRLEYDPEMILSQADHPQRRRLLEEIADQESQTILGRSFSEFQGLSPDSLIRRQLSQRQRNSKLLAILYFAWNPDSRGTEGSASGLAKWLAAQGVTVSLEEAQKWTKSYGHLRLTMADYGYLLNRHPLEVWAAGQIGKQPQISWEELLKKSTVERKAASAWLFSTRNRRAQDLRLKIRFEQDVFARMTPYWRRLGFPFNRLVSSLATAIGSSCDRPMALAELMGIILNDGVRKPTIRYSELRFAQGTAYHTVLTPQPESGTRVLSSPAAHAIREVLEGVVTKGTAIRLSGTFLDGKGKPIAVGGKTGSGDNRHKTFGRGGELISSRAINRTATFVFYVGDRYYGVLTASVLGAQAESYQFTSALPVSALKLLTPAINARFASPPVLVAKNIFPPRF